MRAALTLLCLLLAEPTLAQGERWTGFMEVRSPEFAALDLPFESFARNAVYLLDTVDLVDPHDYRVVTTSSMQRTTDSSFLSSPGGLDQWQIETCRKQGLELCPLVSGRGQGTMFYDSGTFFTCRHVVHNWMALAASLNDRSILSITPPVILRNSQGVVVHNSAYEGRPQLDVAFAQDDPGFNAFLSRSPATRFQGEFARAFHRIDYLEMTLSTPDVNTFTDYRLPLVPAPARTIDEGLPVYVIGYPNRTSLFGGTRGDAPGRTLVASHGFVLGSVDEEVRIESTALTMPGSSGGPVLSEGGYILGVQCNATWTYDDGSLLAPNAVRSWTVPAHRNTLLNAWFDLVAPPPVAWGE